MDESTGAAGYLRDFRARGEAIADVCTCCACPMVAPAELGETDAAETAGSSI